MREVIDLFKEQDTIDELGIGAIRDAFADLLFPGLSTVQTRAKYFLFIPWVYQRVEAERIPSAKAGERARKYQIDLIYSLKNGGAKSSEGVIGWDALGNLQRLPSAVYWSGLAVFGIRRFHGSAQEYHRSLDSYYRRLKDHSSSDSSEIAERLQTNWVPDLPPPPENLWQTTTLELSGEEAGFLRDRINLHRPQSLLAAYLRNSDADIVSAPTPWDHPRATGLPNPTQVWLDHAHLFSDVMHGAPLLYNLMLAERAATVGLSMGDVDLVDFYSGELEEWADLLTAREGALASWDLDEFWNIVRSTNARVPHPTHSFVSRWIGMTQEGSKRLLSTSDDARLLIKDREVRLKGGRSRLNSHHALERWTGASGIAPLTYRWPVAQTMLRDILAA
jgi:hypothetical protein